MHTKLSPVKQKVREENIGNKGHLIDAPSRNQQDRRENKAEYSISRSKWKNRRRHSSNSSIGDFLNMQSNTKRKKGKQNKTVSLLWSAWRLQTCGEIGILHYRRCWSVSLFDCGCGFDCGSVLTGPKTLPSSYPHWHHQLKPAASPPRLSCCDQKNRMIDWPSLGTSKWVKNLRMVGRKQVCCRSNVQGLVTVTRTAFIDRWGRRR